MSSLGVPAKLKEDVLPTDIQIYNHYIHLIQKKCSTGEWKHNTPFLVKARAVCLDVSAVWDRTTISHLMNTREGERKIITLLNKCKNFTKVPLDRRPASFGEELHHLFDVAICQHKVDDSCSCEIQNKVRFIVTAQPNLRTHHPLCTTPPMQVFQAHRKVT